jgi:hypothetical protein
MNTTLFKQNSILLLLPAMLIASCSGLTDPKEPEMNVRLGLETFECSSVTVTRTAGSITIAGSDRSESCGSYFLSNSDRVWAHGVSITLVDVKGPGRVPVGRNSSSSVTAFDSHGGADRTYSSSTGLGSPYVEITRFDPSGIAGYLEFRIWSSGGGYSALLRLTFST